MELIAGLVHRTASRNSHRARPKSSAASLASTQLVSAEFVSIEQLSTELPQKELLLTELARCDYGIARPRPGSILRRLTGSGLLAVFTVLLGAACYSARAQNTYVESASEQKIKKDFYTAQDRLKAMQAAELFAPANVSQMDIAVGPPQDQHLFHIHDNDKIICDYKTPGHEMGGKTPKFGCQITAVESAGGGRQTVTPEITEDEPVKVKYGATDNEVFAEIVATRLMWALGYYADAWYPVVVECHGCPENPISGSGAVATRTYPVANIVRKFSWRKMTQVGKDDEGWSWSELESANGRPVYQRDGLRLLAAFIQHSDNKPPQQRLTCHKVDVDSKTQPPTTTCDKSVMLVQDVGATFGSGGWFTSNTSAKMNIDNWSHKNLWISSGTESAPRSCRAALRKSLTAHGGLSNPAISEDGRRFDAALMCQLTDQQIEALFRASRVFDMPKYHNSDGSFKPGVDENSVTREWVDAFKKKREDLAQARCEWKDKPADLSPIDNPLNLPSVPNYCSSKPF